MNGKISIKDTIVSFLKNKIPENALLPFQHWLLEDTDADEKTEVMHRIWNEMEKPADESTYAELRDIHRRIDYLKRQSQPVFTRFAKIAAVLILPIISFAAAYFYFRDREPDMEIIQYYVAKGETKQITLEDGSLVWVNSDSYISFPKNFSKDKRVVNLTGEAFFEVTKNSKKPFIVNTDKMSVEVLGTKFNINAYPDLNEIKTTLKEGAVAVNVHDGHSHDRFMLSPNEEISLNSQTGAVTKKHIDNTEIPSWSSGDMLFNSSLMSDILMQLERRYGTTISCSDEYLDRRITVKFNKNEELDEVLSVLEILIPGLEASRRDNVVFIENRLKKR